ncbi:MAG: leucine-rich repeat domain-containing protein [Ruminococcus sp.]|nr:leucine-rich repeat domain-containing protein [Ruminococcus sp.]
MPENLWYIDKNGNLRFPDVPEAPEKNISAPYPHALWRITGDVPVHRVYPKAPEKPVNKPYPSALWTVDGDGLTHELYPEIPENSINKPYPKALWRIDNSVSDLPYHELLPIEIPAGAFMGVKTLEYVRIPETVRKIGRYAFADTALKKVRISPDCEYFDTSFPENCIIEFYGNLYNKYSEQLYDCNGNILIDIDGARIYVKE